MMNLFSLPLMLLPPSRGGCFAVLQSWRLLFMTLWATVFALAAPDGLGVDFLLEVVLSEGKQTSSWQGLLSQLLVLERLAEEFPCVLASPIVATGTINAQSLAAVELAVRAVRIQFTDYVTDLLVHAVRLHERFLVSSGSRETLCTYTWTHTICILLYITGTFLSPQPFDGNLRLVSTGMSRFSRK